MVSFTRTPYGEAVRRAKRQDRVVTIFTILISALVLTVFFRLTLGDRWVASLSMAATIVYIGVQIVIARLRKGGSLTKAGAPPPCP